MLRSTHSVVIGVCALIDSTTVVCVYLPGQFTSCSWRGGSTTTKQTTHSLTVWHFSPLMKLKPVFSLVSAEKVNERKQKVMAIRWVGQHEQESEYPGLWRFRNLRLYKIKSKSRSHCSKFFSRLIKKSSDVLNVFEFSLTMQCQLCLLKCAYWMLPTYKHTHTCTLQIFTV